MIAKKPQEFHGRKRIFVVWVKRVSLKSTNWEPIACLTRGEATGEIRRARKAGDMAFVGSYLKAKRTSKDRATESAAEAPSDDRCPSVCDGNRCTKRRGHRGRHYALRPTGGWGADEPKRMCLTCLGDHPPGMCPEAGV